MKRPTARHFAAALLDQNKEKTGKELKNAVAFFLRFFARHHRQITTSALIRACEEYRTRTEKKESAVVRSALPISKKQREQLAQIFPQKQITFSEPEQDLLGGIRVEANDTIFDGTLKQTLERLSLTLTH